MRRHKPRNTPRPPWKQASSEPGTRPYIIDPDAPPIYLTDEAAAIVRDVAADFVNEALRSAALYVPGQTLILEPEEIQCQ